MFYEYECPICGDRRTLCRRIDERDDFVACEHWDWNPNVGSKTIINYEAISMQRIVSDFTFNANLEKDKPENQYYRIIGGHSQQEQLEAMRREEKIAEQRLANTPDPAPYVSMDDILSTGIRPDMSPEGVRQWREEHIPKDTFAEVSNPNG